MSTSRNESSADSHSTGAFAIQLVSNSDERKLDNITMKGSTKELIDFQNFLILDGQLDIEPDEVSRNAEIYLKSINSSPVESQSVSKNEQSDKDCVNCKYKECFYFERPCHLCNDFDLWKQSE